MKEQELRGVAEESHMRWLRVRVAPKVVVFGIKALQVAKKGLKNILCLVVIGRITANTRKLTIRNIDIVVGDKRFLR